MQISDPFCHICDVGLLTKRSKDAIKWSKDATEWSPLPPGSQKFKTLHNIRVIILWSFFGPVHIFSWEE